MLMCMDFCLKTVVPVSSTRLFLQNSKHASPFRSWVVFLRLMDGTIRPGQIKVAFDVECRVLFTIPESMIDPTMSLSTNHERSIT
jgi:hypothetical protein